MLKRRKQRKNGDSGDLGAIDGAAAVEAVEPSPGGPVNPRARLGEMLVREGVITQGQLDDALTQQQEQGGFLGNTLVSLRYLDQHTLVSFLVKQCKIPHISLLDYSVDDALFNLVPKDLCLEHLCIPIDKLGRILTIAMVNPFDSEALESVRSTCPDLKIKPILCDYNHFAQVARKYLKGPESTPEQGDDVSAESFGLSAAAPSKRVAKARPKKQRTEINEPAEASTLKKGGVTVDAPVDPNVLAVQIEAALTTGLNEALAPLLKTMESMQQAMESLSRSVAAPANVEAFPEPSGKTKRREADDADVLAASGVVPQGDDCVRGALLESSLCSAYSFDDFFAGSVNAVTESLVRSLPESLDSGLSPMYLNGGAGLGKTHLLHAIGNAYTEANPDIRVGCMTAGMFIRAWESESQGGGIQSFLETFSKADVFLLDDVHLLADKDDVQAALVEIFDALCGARRPIAITGLEGSDGLRGLNTQLQSRLTGSVVAMIKPPDFQTRIEILRHLVSASGIDLPDKILVLIAERVKDDVRRLKGAFEKISAYVRVAGDGISADDARDMIVQFDAEAVA